MSPPRLASDTSASRGRFAPSASPPGPESAPSTAPDSNPAPGSARSASPRDSALAGTPFRACTSEVPFASPPTGSQGSAPLDRAAGAASVREGSAIGGALLLGAECVPVSTRSPSASHRFTASAWDTCGRRAGQGFGLVPWPARTRAVRVPSRWWVRSRSCCRDMGANVVSGAGQRAWPNRYFACLVDRRAMGTTRRRHADRRPDRRCARTRIPRADARLGG
ncbi:Uncharacterised protein [Nocardia brasiliensis]|nr:Uncharacterised protein [Nocardia brasiliensis]